MAPKEAPTAKNNIPSKPKDSHLVSAFKGSRISCFAYLIRRDRNSVNFSEINPAQFSLSLLIRN